MTDFASGLSSAVGQQKSASSGTPDYGFGAGGSPQAGNDAPLTMAQLVWYVHKMTGLWPGSESQVLNWIKQGATYNRLRTYLGGEGKVGYSREGTSSIPSWLIKDAGPELGTNVAYLSVPEVGSLIIQGAAEGWDAGKLQTQLQNTKYVKNSTQVQRDWLAANPADKSQAIATQKVAVMELLEKEYGVKYVQDHGYSLNDPRVAKWATDLASGKNTTDLFTYSIDQNARGIQGTPAYQTLVDEQKNQNKSVYEASNKAEELGSTWRKWMGTQVTPPDLKAWAQNIVAYKASEGDFLNYVRTAAKSLYPNKPEFVSYDDWVSPARSVVQHTLELSNVQDSDPLIQSYVRGQSSLADITEAARRDDRFLNTTSAVADSRNIGMNMLKQMGFAQ